MIRAVDTAPTGARYQWRLADYDAAAVAELQRELRCSSTLATLLWIRNVRDVSQARQFLEPSLHGLSDPDLLPDVKKATSWIREALEQEQPICIYGDYDVDGVTACALFVELFRHLGVSVDFYIPHRLREGYGLNADAIRNIAAQGTRLLITVDGGSNDLEELALAEELGMRVIVTDHHPIRGNLPTVPVVHPGREDAETPFAGLAGVGVAYKVVWALGRELAGGQRVDDSYRQFMISALAFVALGTIADVVPLQDENRMLVHYGLRAFAKSKRPGLRALLGQCRVDPERVRSEDIAFRLAPHINAVGRLGRAQDALELLLTADEARATELAADLGRANLERKSIERDMLEQCEEIISELSPDQLEGPLVLAQPGWHSGVAGIVASRLVDRHHRPVFVIALEEEIGRGSIRSVPDMPLDPYYDAAAGSVLSMGGHACAGGVTLEPGRLDEFRDRLRRAELSFSLDSTPSLTVDAVIAVDDIGLDLLRELDQLEPHGEGNRSPRFRIDDAALLGTPRLVGKDEQHLAFSIRRKGAPLRAIYFSGAEYARRLAETKDRFALVVEIFESTFQGPPTPELRVVDLALP